MPNRDLDAAWTYHNKTKHSYQSIRTGGGGLDWPNMPLPFKIYESLDQIALPRGLSPIDVPALTAISGAGVSFEDERVPELTALAQVLFFSAGITKRKRLPDREILFRVASCTGALYHIDLYIICGNLPGLEAGVYHFGPQDFSLRRLRSGDYRAAAVIATGGEPSVASAPVIIAYASTYWRNAWKYRSRAYRHAFWDSGTILANTLATAAALDLPARAVLGYADETLSALLGLDGEREGTISLVALGHASAEVPPAPAAEPLSLPTTPLSPTERGYPLIREIHAASSLTQDEVEAWRGKPPSLPVPEPAGRLFPLAPLSDGETQDDSLQRVIIRRGSTREFDPEASISFSQLSTMLRASTRGIPADVLQPNGVSLNHLYLIVHAVDGLPSGAYVYDPEHEALELLKEGSFRSEAGFLGLEQALPAMAAVNVYFLTDLRSVLERFGNRGYRAAQLEAAIMGGKLYLAAYAQRLGATGLTFYDDEVTAFFSPHAAGKSVMFLVALGRSVRRP